MPGHCRARGLVGQGGEYLVIGGVVWSVVRVGGPNHFGMVKIGLG